MEVKNLSQIDFSELIECFLRAFENYFVKMPTDPMYYKLRWEMANVKLDFSYGMFDNDKLVGFIINAIAERNGNLIAFNTGTGVLPKYRGQRIVKTIYDYAIPELKKRGVEKCMLEVIKDNTIAIKTYERIGFITTKSYKCYGGVVSLKNEAIGFEVKKVAANYFDWNNLRQHTYSWDNHINTIKRGNYNYYVVLIQGNLESYFIINPQNGYVAQFDVLNESRQAWNHLFSAIKGVSEAVKINNVDEQLNSKMDYLNQIGLNNTVDQYEMEFDI